MSEIDANVARVQRLDTATLSDALDRLGLVGQCAGLSPRDPGFRLAGRAFTVLYGPAGSPAGTVGDFLDDVVEGMVVAIDNGGRQDTTVWGDILTELAHLKKISGTVIDGINRDTALCLKLGYPVFSRAAWMRTGKDRVQVEAVGVPVNIGNARVCPGDLMKGDTDGVIVIPRSHEDRVLDVAEEIHEAEERIRAAVRSGVSLAQARAKNRYHSLQTREAQ